MSQATTGRVSDRMRSEIHTAVQQEILTAINEVETDSSSGFTMLNDKMDAIHAQLTSLSTWMDSDASDRAKWNKDIAELCAKNLKQAKLLTDLVKQYIRSIITNDYDEKYVTKRVISSAQDVLDFIADNLGKDEQWRSQAADLLRRKMEEEV